MRRFSLVLAFMLANAGVACADLAVTAVPACPPAVVAPPQDTVDRTVRDTAWNGVSRPGLLDENPWASLPAAADQGDDLSLRELPGLPDSSSLFLSAMLSVGAWHAARRAGHLHLASLPEWYHSDAPYQIGHSVAFDPVTGFDCLPVCLFDSPDDTQAPALGLDIWCDLPSHRDFQHLLKCDSPRGPPSNS